MRSVKHVRALLHEVRLFPLNEFPIVWIYHSANLGIEVTLQISPSSP
jgi:hypothetical protein